MSSDTAQVDACRRHCLSATPPDAEDELDTTSSKRYKHQRSGSGGGEMADEDSDRDGVADGEGFPGDYGGDSPVEVPRPLPDDLEEGEILDEEGLFSTNPVRDAEAASMAVESSAKGGTSNGDLVSDASGKDKKEVHAAPKISSGEKSRYFSDYVMDAESDSKIFLPSNAAIKYSTSGTSPYSDRYEDDRVEAVYHLGERSHSTPHEENALFKGRKHLERDSSYYSGWHRSDYDSDDRHVSSLEKSRRHGSRDTVKDPERERVSSRSRYDSKDDRHHIRYGSRDRSTSIEIESGRKRDERERSRDRDVGKDKKRSYRERSIDWDSERDSRREKWRDRGTVKEIDEVRRREKERDQNGESERNKERRMERQRDRSRDRVLDKDRKREKEDDRSGDEKFNKDRRGDKERNRNYGREKESSRNRGRKREREKLEDLRGERSRKSAREKSEDRKRPERKDVGHVLNHENHEDNFSRGDLKNKDNVKCEDPGKLRTDYMESVNDSQGRDEDELDDSEENLSFLVPEQEEDHLNKIKEESRRLKQAILEKYKNQQQLQGQKDVEAQVKVVVEGRTIVSSKPSIENPGEVADGGEDYVVEPLFSVGKSPSRNETTITEKAYGERGLGEGTPKSERSADMFHDEIFGDSPAGFQKPDKVGGELVEKSGLNDNWDDAEGYYCYSLGEKLDARYEVIAAHGKGVFSTVVRAKDVNAGVGEPKEVAVKILRNKEAMYKAGVQELGILKKLVGADPEDKRQCSSIIKL